MIRLQDKPAQGLLGLFCNDNNWDSGCWEPNNTMDLRILQITSGLRSRNCTASVLTQMWPQVYISLCSYCMYNILAEFEIVPQLWYSIVILLHLTRRWYILVTVGCIYAKYMKSSLKLFYSLCNHLILATEIMLQGYGARNI